MKAFATNSTCQVYPASAESCEIKLAPQHQPIQQVQQVQQLQPHHRLRQLYIHPRRVHLASITSESPFSNNITSSSNSNSNYRINNTSNNCNSNNFNSSINNFNSSINSTTPIFTCNTSNTNFSLTNIKLLNTNFSSITNSIITTIKLHSSTRQQQQRLPPLTITMPEYITKLIITATSSTIITHIILATLDPDDTQNKRQLPSNEDLRLFWFSFISYTLILFSL